MGTRSNEHYTLLTDYDAGSAYSEAYRTLYANISIDWHGSKGETTRPHSLLITTPAASSEYRTVAANLAIVAAQSGAPAILVDADLRTPHLQQRFGLGKSVGLAELLEEESLTPQKVASSLQTTFIPNLRLLGAGEATPQAEALMLSPRLEEVIRNISLLLQEAETQAGIVIFHSQPVLASADASLVGSLVDQTFLVIAAGATTRAQARQAQEQLERAHVKIAGIIMTGK